MLGVGTHSTLTAVYVEHVCMKLKIIGPTLESWLYQFMSGHCSVLCSFSNNPSFTYMMMTDKPTQKEVKYILRVLHTGQFYISPFL